MGVGRMRYLSCERSLGARGVRLPAQSDEWNHVRWTMWRLNLTVLV